MSSVKRLNWFQIKHFSIESKASYVSRIPNKDTMNNSRKETERTKFIQEKCQTLLTLMLRDEDNKYCVDCDAKGKWNSTIIILAFSANKNVRNIQ